MRRLRELRKKRKLDVSVTAPTIGADPQMWWRWERGASEPDWETAERIADLFNVSLDQLAGRVPIPELDQHLEEIAS